MLVDEGKLDLDARVQTTRFSSNPDHSTSENRFVLLGLSGAGRDLVVVHYYREADAVIATRSERRTYLER